MEIRKYDITVAGHICLDIIPRIPDTGAVQITDFFKPGKLIQVKDASVSTGGPVSNTGIAMSRLGLEVAFMTRVGKDAFGDLVMELLEKQGHTDGVSLTSEDRTSYTIVIAPPGIDRIFFHNPGANDTFTHADLNDDVVAESSLFHFGYPPLMISCYTNEGEELRRIFERAKTSGATTSLDMALPDPQSPSGKAPWAKILEKVLPHVDIFLPSIEEIFFMLDPEKYLSVKSQAGSKDIIDYIDPCEYSRLAAQCIEMGCKIVALKASYRGYYILTSSLHEGALSHPPKDPANWSNRELWCPAFHIGTIASATGSGDSSIAGFLSAYMKGLPIEKALKVANCVGFQNLHELDAVSGIQTWDETMAMIDKGTLKMNEIPLKDTGWTWDDEFELWRGNADLE